MPSALVRCSIAAATALLCSKLSWWPRSLASRSVPLDVCIVVLCVDELGLDATIEELCVFASLRSYKHRARHPTHHLRCCNGCQAGHQQSSQQAAHSAPPYSLSFSSLCIHHSITAWRRKLGEVACKWRTKPPRRRRETCTTCTSCTQTPLHLEKLKDNSPTLTQNG